VSEAILVPATVFVGDKGRLIYPLQDVIEDNDGANAEVRLVQAGDAAGDTAGAAVAGDAVVAGEDGAIGDIVVEGLAFDRGQNSLIIDFRAYKVGDVAVPPVMVGRHRIDGITVKVSSVLENDVSTLTLSPLSAPMLAPGTGVLAVGLVAITVFLAVLIVWLRKGGLSRIRVLIVKHRKRKLIAASCKLLDRLKAGLDEKKLDAASALNKASHEFRVFLELFFNSPCLSFVPEEFQNFPVDAAVPPDAAVTPAQSEQAGIAGVSGVDALSAQFLCNIFQTSDNLRFGAQTGNSQGTRMFLDSIYLFLTELKKRQTV
jgi:hypothetical protein